MVEENKVAENVAEVSSNLNALSYYMVELDAVLATVEELMEDVDEAIHKGWHKERTAELLVNTIGRKVRIIDMALRPLSKHMTEKVEVANDTAEEIVKYFYSENV